MRSYISAMSLFNTTQTAVYAFDPLAHFRSVVFLDDKADSLIPSRRRSTLFKSVCLLAQSVGLLVQSVYLLAQSACLLAHKAFTN